MNFFNINKIMIFIPLGNEGYALSWIETIAALFGLLCIWCASKEKIINYPFGLINVTLFTAIFFQIQLYASMLLQLFFFSANLYGWYAWSCQNEAKVAVLKIRWLSRTKMIILSITSVLSIIFMTFFIDPIFRSLTRLAMVLMQGMGYAEALPELQPAAAPFWDSCILILSIIAMLLMTRKYVENWILWVVIDVISAVLYSSQGVYFISLEYVLLTAIALMGSINWIRIARSNGFVPLASHA